MTRLGLVAESSFSADGLEVRTVTLDLDGARVRLAGHMQGGAIDMRATVKHLATARLARYWPPHAAAGARRWVVANLSGGHIRSGDAHVVGTLATQPRPRFVPGIIRGAFVFDGVTVRYQPSMPPATGVAGTGTFDGKRWHVHAARGVVGRLALVRGSVAIPGARPDASLADVEAGLRGSLVDALALLRHAPFAQAAAPDLDLASIAGTGVTELFVRVPRAPGPPDIRASARLSEVAIARIFRGASLREGAFTLALDARELRLEGDGRLEGVPLSLAWTEERASGRPRRVIDVRGRVDAAGRAALGVDLSPWVEGPIDVKAHYDGDRAQRGTLDVRADLHDAVLAVPVRGLSKDAGTPGEAQARLDVRDGNVSAIRELVVWMGSSRVNGRASRSPDGVTWRTIEAEAKLVAPIPGGRPTACTLTAESLQSGHRFRLASDDAGALLEQLAFGRNATGGTLVFAGTMDLAVPGQPLDARLDVRDLTVLRAPVLARLATLASVSGLRDALAGSGVRFRQVEAGIRHRDAVVTIVDGLARGPSLGIALRGTIDRKTGIGDLRGTFIPSYSGLNTAPARIPVIGAFATGRDEAGVHAVDFAVTGPMANPAVAVDPVSVLTPGALRDLVRRLGR